MRQQQIKATLKVIMGLLFDTTKNKIPYDAAKGKGYLQASTGVLKKRSKNDEPIYYGYLILVTTDKREFQETAEDLRNYVKTQAACTPIVEIIGKDVQLDVF